MPVPQCLQKPRRWKSNCMTRFQSHTMQVAKMWPQHLAPSRRDAASQVKSKLHLILQKIDELENKNSRLEKTLDEQRVPVGLKPQSIHSSPKCSHKCSKEGILVYTGKEGWCTQQNRSRWMKHLMRRSLTSAPLELLALKCHNCWTARHPQNNHPYSSLKMMIGFKIKCKNNLKGYKGNPEAPKTQVARHLNLVFIVWSSGHIMV